MREFSAVDLAQRFERVARAATVSPVSITHGRKGHFVLMTAERFERMKRSDPRRVYRTDETPPELAKLLLKGLDNLIKELDEAD